MKKNIFIVNYSNNWIDEVREVLSLNKYNLFEIDINNIRENSKEIINKFDELKPFKVIFLLEEPITNDCYIEINTFLSYWCNHFNCKYNIINQENYIVVNKNDSSLINYLLCNNDNLNPFNQEFNVCFLEDLLLENNIKYIINLKGFIEKFNKITNKDTEFNFYNKYIKYLSENTKKLLHLENKSDIINILKENIETQERELSFIPMLGSGLNVESVFMKWIVFTNDYLNLV